MQFVQSASRLRGSANAVQGLNAIIQEVGGRNRVCACAVSALLLMALAGATAASGYAQSPHAPVVSPVVSEAADLGGSPTGASPDPERPVGEEAGVAGAPETRAQAARTALTPAAPAESGTPGPQSAGAGGSVEDSPRRSGGPVEGLGLRQAAAPVEASPLETRADTAEPTVGPAGGGSSPEIPELEATVPSRLARRTEPGPSPPVATERGPASAPEYAATATERIPASSAGRGAGPSAAEGRSSARGLDGGDPNGAGRGPNLDVPPGQVLRADPGGTPSTGAEHGPASPAGRARGPAGSRSRPSGAGADHAHPSGAGRGAPPTAPPGVPNPEWPSGSAPGTREFEPDSTHGRAPGSSASADRPEFAGSSRPDFVDSSRPVFAGSSRPDLVAAPDHPLPGTTEGTQTPGASPPAPPTARGPSSPLGRSAEEPPAKSQSNGAGRIQPVAETAPARVVSRAPGTSPSGTDNEAGGPAPARSHGTARPAIEDWSTPTAAGRLTEPAPANGESVTPPAGPLAKPEKLPVETPSPAFADTQHGTAPPLVRPTAETNAAPALPRAAGRIDHAVLPVNTAIAGLMASFRETVSPLFAPSATAPDGRTAQRPASGSGSAPSHVLPVGGGATASGGVGGAAAGALLALLMSFASFCLHLGVRLSVTPDVHRGQEFLAVIERPG
jgi:hypothetical protein